MENLDFSEMLSALNAEGVESLVVGAYAVGAHGLPRATKDLDVWVRPTSENAERVFRALVRFGAPVRDVTPADFARKGTGFQIGVAPLRIDILTQVSGVEFEEAWPGRLTAHVEGTTVPVIGRADLLRNKRAAGPPQDLADAARLENVP